jgi:hypothetical protein
MHAEPGVTSSGEMDRLPVTEIACWLRAPGEWMRIRCSAAQVRLTQVLRERLSSKAVWTWLRTTVPCPWAMLGSPAGQAVSVGLLPKRA